MHAWLKIVWTMTNTTNLDSHLYFRKHVHAVLAVKCKDWPFANRWQSFLQLDSSRSIPNGTLFATILRSLYFGTILVLIHPYYHIHARARARVCVCVCVCVCMHVCMYVCICYNVTIKNIHSQDEYLSRYVKYFLIKKQCVTTISMHESLKHPWRIIKKEIYPSARQVSQLWIRLPFKRE